MAAIVGTVLTAVAPQIGANPIVKPAVALLAGGPIAAAAQLFLGGGLQGITSIFGGSSNGGGSNAGFA